MPGLPRSSRTIYRRMAPEGRTQSTINTRYMTPQEKAKQLVDKFTVVGLQQRNEGIQCALIMVDELLSNSTFLLSIGELYYWNEVKKEIEKL